MKLNENILVELCSSHTFRSTFDFSQHYRGFTPHTSSNCCNEIKNDLFCMLSLYQSEMYADYMFTNRELERILLQLWDVKYDVINPNQTFDESIPKNLRGYGLQNKFITSEKNLNSFERRVDRLSKIEKEYYNFVISPFNPHINIMSEKLDEMNIQRTPIFNLTNYEVYLNNLKRTCEINTQSRIIITQLRENDKWS